MDIPLPRNGGKVIGVGVDLVDVERIRAMAQRHGGQFLDRVFTAEERAYCDKMKNPYPFYAARFATKEAVAKAFSTGIGEHLAWQSIAVAKGERGQPEVVLDEKARNLLAQLGGSEILVSITHTDTLGHAVALIVTH